MIVNEWDIIGTEHKLSQTNGMSWFNQTEAEASLRQTRRHNRTSTVADKWHVAVQSNRNLLQQTTHVRTYVNQIRTYVRIQFQEAYCTTRRRVICNPHDCWQDWGGGWRVGSWEEENHGSGAEEQQIFKLFWNPMQAYALVQLCFNFKQSIKKWQAHWTALRNLALCRWASANCTHDPT